MKDVITYAFSRNDNLGSTGLDDILTRGVSSNFLLQVARLLDTSTGVCCGNWLSMVPKAQFCLEHRRQQSTFASRKVSLADSLAENCKHRAGDSAYTLFCITLLRAC